MAEILDGEQELRPQVAVAALALNGLGDEAGDVMGVRLERGPGFGKSQLLGGFDLGQVGLEWVRMAGEEILGQSNFG